MRFIIKEEIQNSLKNYEPRIELLEVTDNPDYDANSFDCIITYGIVGIDLPPSKLEFALLPTR